jgi:hypothetical protein
MLFRQVVECGSPLPLFSVVRKDFLEVKRRSRDERQWPQEIRADSRRLLPTSPGLVTF